MLVMYALTVPLVVVAFVDSTWLGIVVNFFCVQSYWCLNEVARDLEDPFVYDPNDLPLARYQVCSTPIVLILPGAYSEPAFLCIYWSLWQAFYHRDSTFRGTTHP